MENATSRDIPTTTVTQHQTDSEAQPESSPNARLKTPSNLPSPSSRDQSSSNTPPRAISPNLVEGKQIRPGRSMEFRPINRLSRPPLGSRHSSGSIIVHRDQLDDYKEREEFYSADDARAMSPRRTSGEIDRMGDDARQALEQQALALQSNLTEILERVQSVRSEHEKLEGGNKFLQSYIGELMQTSKITSTGAPKSKKGRGNK